MKNILSLVLALLIVAVPLSVFARVAVIETEPHDESLEEPHDESAEDPHDESGEEAIDYEIKSTDQISFQGLNQNTAELINLGLVVTGAVVLYMRVRGLK